MRISFDLKKGVVVNLMLFLALGLIATSAIAQQSYVNFANPWYNNGALPSLTWSDIQPNEAFHTLQLISKSANNPSTVDRNSDGVIDLAENAMWAGVAKLANDSNSVSGFVPSSQVLSKGCVVVDTGLSANGDAFVGFLPLDLRISSTLSGNPVGGQPALTVENICSDGDGCTYRVMRYKNTVPTHLFSGGVNSFWQMPISTGPGRISTSDWVDQGNTVGTNGGGQTRFVNWAPTAGPGMEIYDDHPNAEMNPDMISINDMDTSASFMVSFCD